MRAGRHFCDTRYSTGRIFPQPPLANTLFESGMMITAAPGSSTVFCLLSLLDGEGQIKHSGQQDRSIILQAADLASYDFAAPCHQIDRTHQLHVGAENPFKENICRHTVQVAATSIW